MSYSASPERNSQGKRLNEETEQISIQWSLHIQKENSNPKDCSTQLRKPDNRNHCGKTAIATAEAMPDWSSLGQRLPCLLPLPQHRATSKCQTHFLNQSHNSVLFCSLSTHSSETSNWCGPTTIYFSHDKTCLWVSEERKWQSHFSVWKVARG